MERNYEILAKAFERLAKGLERIEARLDDVLDVLATSGPITGVPAEDDLSDLEDLEDLETSPGDARPVEITRVRIG